MPAIDQCEPAVINALQKAGWVVTHQPYTIRTEPGVKNYVFVDLRLRQVQNRRSIIITEVKCFSDKRRLMDDFYQSVGQYITYRSALAMKKISTPLYLAVPLHIYDTFFQKPLIRKVIGDSQINLLMVDTEIEEVIIWINSPV